MLVDKIIPENRDCTGHSIRIEGAFPRKTITVVFDYGDGSQRQFDGRLWSVTKPSRAMTRRVGAIWTQPKPLPTPVPYAMLLDKGRY